MARARASLVYVGIRAHVVAFDRRNGTEVWRTALPARYKSSSGFVTVMRDSDGLFAACAGELFALDPRTGALLWHDPMKGLGTGLVTMVSELGGTTPEVPSAHAQRQRDAAASAAAAS
jgi:outer membrane protein assembly factor BamB